MNNYYQDKTDGTMWYLVTPVFEIGGVAYGRFADRNWRDASEINKNSKLRKMSNYINSGVNNRTP